MLLNKPRAVEFMQRCQLDAIVATSPINVTYLSDYYSWIDSQLKEYMRTAGGSGHLVPGFAVLPLQGAPALVLHSIFALNASGIWVRDLYLYGDPFIDDMLPAKGVAESQQDIFGRLKKGQRSANPVDALCAIFSERGITSGRIGLEVEGLPPGMKETIAARFPHAEFKDCSDLLRVIRMVKSPEELERLRRAAEIAETSAMEALAMARPGIHTCELVRQYRVSLASKGAEFDHFAFCLRGMGVASEPEYQFQSDDIMYVDYGCIYKRYLCDTGTTLAVNEPSGEIVENHEVLRACIKAGAEALRPGAKASVVQAAMAEVIAEHGMRASFPHGHGLGLESCEYPLVVPDNGRRVQDDCIDLSSDLLMESGMVINLEARNFRLGVDSIHTESSFLVTPAGCEALVHQDRRKPVCPREAAIAARRQ